MAIDTGVTQGVENGFRPVDEVDHPAHYTYSSVEPLDVIEAWDLPFHLGNVVKYVARAGHKGAALKDLRKARRYLDRYIGLLEKRETPYGKPYVVATGKLTLPVSGEPVVFTVPARPQDEYL